ncbi:metal-binding protein [Halobacteriales archaeon QS_1_68_20]|nr:MAG: metal-binding protein [Halobacteriales archaeon QS_1_68_20]
MKKQELIHLHGLLAEVSNHFEHRHDREIDLEKYESQGVRPTSIHKSKTDHKDAVFALAEGITTAMADRAESETVPAAAD